MKNHRGREHMRQENDSLGTVMVPEDKLYGSQTGRSKNFFSYGKELMPKEVIYALVKIKNVQLRQMEIYSV